MKQVVFFSFLLLAQSLFGFHAGVGYSWNTIDETFHSKLITNEDRSGKDQYRTHENRFAPVVELGHRFCLCDDWTFNLLAEWKYLNYRTANVESSRGQILPNATFSSINIFGDDTHRDFTSETHLRNEVVILGCFGKEVLCGYAYVGVGPAFFDASNRIFVTAVHTPNGVGDHLLSTFVKKNKIIWGGAVRIGYEYFFSPCYFINVSYNYLQTGNCRFKNSENTAILNGFDTPGPTTLFLKRSVRFTVQEFVCSVNMVF